MCGRFLIDYEFRELIDKYNLSKYQGSMNEGEIFPSQKVMTVVEKYAIAMDWGFEFDWSKNRIINARSETIFEKRTFKALAAGKRCIVPASAYFEWKKTNDKKIKYKIATHSEGIISLAGLYQIVTDKNNNKIYQFTILTKEADETTKAIHHRMPVIIKEKNQEEWLFSKKLDSKGLKNMINNQKLSLKVKIV